MAEFPIDRAATQMLICESTRTHRAPWTASGQLSLADGYRVQDETLRRRLARGEAVTGIKLGLTSVEKQRAAGVDTSLVAWLTDAMAVSDGTQVPLTTLMRPMAEPEIVFVMGRDLTEPVTAREALAAVEWVCGGAELPDTRYEGAGVTPADTVADDAGAAAYVLGPIRLRPDEIDLMAETVEVAVDGRVVGAASGTAVLGNPAEALAQAVNVLVGRNMKLGAGQIVFSGGMVDAVAVTTTSTITFRFGHLGTFDIRGVD